MSIKISRTVANYIEPAARGIKGCHNCTRMQMQPSLSGSRQAYCSRLGCWVKEMAICDHYALAPAKTTNTGESA